MNIRGGLINMKFIKVFSEKLGGEMTVSFPGGGEMNLRDNSTMYSWSWSNDGNSHWTNSTAGRWSNDSNYHWTNSTASRWSNDGGYKWTNSTGSKWSNYNTNHWSNTTIGSWSNNSGYKWTNSSITWNNSGSGK